MPLQRAGLGCSAVAAPATVLCVSMAARRALPARPPDAPASGSPRQRCSGPALRTAEAGATCWWCQQRHQRKAQSHHGGAPAPACIDVLPLPPSCRRFGYPRRRAPRSYLSTPTHVWWQRRLSCCSSPLHRPRVVVMLVTAGLLACAHGRVRVRSRARAHRGLFEPDVESCPLRRPRAVVMRVCARARAPVYALRV